VVFVRVFVENHACTIKIPAKFIFKGSVFLQPSGQIGLGLWYLMPLSTIFQLSIVAVSFIVGGNRI
jgi:hypothetical protein